MHVNDVSGRVVDAAVKIHKKLGPGLLESVYEVILAYELKRDALQVQRQVPIPIVWDGIQFEEGYRLDLIVDEQVVIDVKSVEVVHPVHKKQLLTYLRLLEKPLGLILNFNVNLMKDGIHRIANGLPDD
jgi:GxxExxY protein